MARLGWNNLSCDELSWLRTSLAGKTHPDLNGEKIIPKICDLRTQAFLQL